MTKECPAGVDPKKFDACVSKVKSKGGDVDPYAVCTVALEKAGDKEVGDKEIGEAASSAAYGQLMRPGAKKESAIKIKEKYFVSLREAKTDAKGNKRFNVTIIRQGLGNLRDKNYYTADAIKSGVPVYEGKKAYYDHPTPESEEQMPNRSVHDIVGHYENVKASQGEDGLMELNADLVPIAGQSRSDATEMLTHAVEYKKKYPDQDFVGLSINGDGEGQSMEYKDFLEAYRPSASEMEKLSKIEGQQVNAITKLTDGGFCSADIVTEPGAGGKVTALKESKTKLTKGKKMLNAMRKFFSGVEKKDHTVIESAVKDMLQDEAEPKKEDEAKAGHEALAKKMLQWKKENRKGDSEDEAAYEAKALCAAHEAFDKEAAEAKAKAEDEGKDKEDESKKEGEKEAPKKDDDKDGDEAEKKEAAGDKEPEADGEKDHADADQDKALIKKMMKQMGEMEASIATMQKQMKQSESEAKEATESAAKAKTELEIKTRTTLIESKLATCGLSRKITGHWKPVLEKARSEKEMDEIISKMRETASRALEEGFVYLGARGTIERTESGTTTSNDELFKYTK